MLLYLRSIFHHLVLFILECIRIWICAFVTKIIYKEDLKKDLNQECNDDITRNCEWDCSETKTIYRFK